MPADGIFLIDGDLDSGEAQLFEMTEQPYDSEDVLQTLLEKYPNLLAGGQIDPDSPRRWLLVKREQSAADEMTGAGRWSLDHLFLDQDGIPTLVEVKRAKDTRIRREVVGQLLDYAANGVAYWPMERIRLEFEERQEDPEAVVRAALGEDVDSDELWSRAAENLQQGKVRLLFVADEIPRELRRIVEFLNEQMRADVLAVSVKRHGAPGTGSRTLVATVYGATERSREGKRAGPRAKRDWTETSFFEELAVRNRGTIDVARSLHSWARDAGLGIRWGEGVQIGTMNVYATTPGHYIFAVKTTGGVEVGFGYLAKTSAFQSDSARLDLLARLNTIPTVQIPAERTSMYPTIPLEALALPDHLQMFKDTVLWVADTIRANGAT